MMTFLGYYQNHEVKLMRPGDRISATAALSEGPKPKVGRGMESGRIVVKLDHDKVRVALFTPQGRSWYGPLFDGKLKEDGNQSTLLLGRFRCTYLEMLSMGLVQLGLVISATECLLGKRYREVGFGLPIALLAFVALFGVAVFLPRLSWSPTGANRSGSMQFVGGLRLLSLFNIHAPVAHLDRSAASAILVIKL